MNIFRNSVQREKMTSKTQFHFLSLPSYELLRVTFYVIITVSLGKGSTVFCKLELHVLRQENRAYNLA